MSKSIPQLTAKTSAEADDLLHIVRDNVDYKITYENFVADVNGRYGNTIFINSVTGNDITGEVENPAKPFATFAAARTASVAYYTGGTSPSSTNLITFDVRGTFSENISLLDFHSYNLNDSYITSNITDPSAVNCTIYGNGTLTSVGNVIFLAYGSSVSLYAKRVVGGFRLDDASAALRVVVYNIVTTGASTLTLNAGNVTFFNAIISNTGAPLCQQGVAGSVLFRNCELTSDQEVIKTGTASNSSSVIIRNSRLKTTGTNYDTINLLTNTGTNMYLSIMGSTLIANGTGNCIDAAQATNVRIYGACETNLTHDTGNVTLLVGTVANNRFVIDTNVE
jgi:hypothetical protein